MDCRAGLDLGTETKSLLGNNSVAYDNDDENENYYKFRCKLINVFVVMCVVVTFVCVHHVVNRGYLMAACVASCHATVKCLFQ